VRSTTCRSCGAELTLEHPHGHKPGCEFGTHPFEATVIPSCPESCVWRETCSTSTQEGIAGLWREGKLTKPQDCTFYERRAMLHRAVTGCEPPQSIAELRAQLATATRVTSIADATGEP